MAKHEPTEIALIFNKKHGGTIPGLPTKDIPLGELPARETWDWASVLATGVYSPGPAWPGWDRPAKDDLPAAAEPAAKEHS